MDCFESIAEAQITVAGFFQEVSHIIASVEEKLLANSFEPVGDSDVFQDVSQSFDFGSRWIPRYVARAYIKGKRPAEAIGYCIHFGPYTDPAGLSFLEKSNLSLPFISLACLKNMQPGPLELNRRQIWDRIWDSGWWATYEDQVKGPLRIYTTTKSISGFQATVAGALARLLPLEDKTAVAEKIATTLVFLHENNESELLKLPYLLPQK